ncbi:MAG: ABC transporter permease [Candidatus Sumerlaeaceae bacterium]
MSEPAFIAPVHAEMLDKVPLSQRLPLDRLMLIGALLIVFAFFWYRVPGGSFGSARNLETIARQTAIVGTAALGMTVIIAAGGIDLSVGSVVALTTVIIAFVLRRFEMRAETAGNSELPQYAAYIAALAGILVATACGLLNGILTTSLRIVPFIVTLGTLLLFRGFATGTANEQKIDAPMTWLADVLAALQKNKQWMLVPPGVWMLLGLAVVVAFMLYYTRFGLHVFAVGSNEATARLCGIRVPRVQLLVYMIGGFMAGVAGLLQFSRLTVGDPTVAVGLELDVIAAVVIGGGSLAGGQGSVLGTLVGALFMTTIRSGCSQMGLANWVQQIVTGSIIVIAVTLDRLRHRPGV